MIYTIEAFDTTSWKSYFIGWFLTYDECVKAIKECDTIYKHFYNFMLIKERKPGLSTGSEVFWAYEWNDDEKCYCLEEEEW